VGYVELAGPVSRNNRGRVGDAGYARWEVRRVVGIVTLRGQQGNVAFAAVVPENVHARGRGGSGDARDDEEDAGADVTVAFAARLGDGGRLHVDGHCGVGCVRGVAACTENRVPQQDDEAEYTEQSGDQRLPARPLPGVARPAARGIPGLMIMVLRRARHCAHSNLTYVNWAPIRRAPRSRLEGCRGDALIISIATQKCNIRYYATRRDLST